jgi:arylsulfatase A-like enzyme
MLIAHWLACKDAPPEPKDGLGTDTAALDHTGTVTTSDGPLAFRGRPPRNLLMISIDTTRRDHFGAYSPDGLMPFAAEWMGNSVTLDEHQQCSNWTYASTSCTLLGRYHEENGFAPTLRGDTEPFPDGQVTLAARLHEHGYYSMLLSPNGWLGDKWNNAQGYDDTEPPGTSRTSDVIARGRERVTDAVAAGHDRWFLHVHLMEPHAPYVPPPAYYEEALRGVDPLPKGWSLDTDEDHYAIVNRWPSLTPDEQALLETHLRARYRGELRYLDDQLREQWAILGVEGFLEDALVVVWTDHGEQIYERGHESHAWQLNAEENDGVAFFWAANLQPGRWTEPTHAVDLVPTVLSALGFPTDDPTLSGYPLGAAPRDRHRFGMSVARGGVLQSVTRGERKLIFDWDEGVTVYDRAVDRHEEVDTFDPADPEDLALWNALLPRVPMLRALVPDERFVWPAELPHP